MIDSLADLMASGIEFAMGVVFVLSFSSKAANVPEFGRIVRDYEIVPGTLVRPTAVLVIVAEGFFAVTLITGLAATLQMALSVLMLVVFLGAVTVVMKRGRSTPCGCFWNRAAPVSQATRRRLLLLIAGGTLVTLAKAIDAPGRLWVGVAPSSMPAGGVLVACVAAFMLASAMWLLAAPDTLRLVRSRTPNG